jgi:hypothetical protein
MAILLGVWLVYLALRFRLSKRARIAAGSLGAAFTLTPVVVYGVSPLPALVLACALLVLSLRHEIRRAADRIRASKPAEQNG